MGKGPVEAAAALDLQRLRAVDKETAAARLVNALDEAQAIPLCALNGWTST